MLSPVVHELFCLKLTEPHTLLLQQPEQQDGNLMALACSNFRGRARESQSRISLRMDYRALGVPL